MRFLITAISFDADGNVMHGKATDGQGRRTEEVDTEANPLFADCRGRWDVEDTYEAFWNRINNFWETDFPAGKGRAKVVKIEPLDEAARTARSTNLTALRLQQDIVAYHIQKRESR
jgi:hypothetical protein